jgi:hypothetical protein
MEPRKIVYTQPELAAGMAGGFAAMNTLLIAAHNQGQTTRNILYSIYALGFLLFVVMIFFIARKRSILEVEENCLRARKKVWYAGELKEIVWNSKARRLMLKPKTGSALSLTLTKNNAEPDSRAIMKWAKVYGVSVQQK